MLSCVIPADTVLHVSHKLRTSAVEKKQTSKTRNKRKPHSPARTEDRIIKFTIKTSINQVTSDKLVEFQDAQVSSLVIGHLKSNHRLSRNFYKGAFGDKINVMLSAAAYNFKRAIKLLLCFFFEWICGINGHDEEPDGNIVPRIEYSSSCSLELVCQHRFREKDF